MDKLLRRARGAAGRLRLRDLLPRPGPLPLRESDTRVLFYFPGNNKRKASTADRAKAEPMGVIEQHLGGGRKWWDAKQRHARPRWLIGKVSWQLSSGGRRFWRRLMANALDGKMILVWMGVSFAMIF